MTSNTVIDLTASSPSPPPKLPTPNAASLTLRDASSSDESNQPSSKEKLSKKAPGIVNGISERSGGLQVSMEPAQSKEGTAPSSTPQRKPRSKRKRDHVDHAPEQASGPTNAVSEMWDRPGPLKRHKPDQDDGFRPACTSPAPVNSVLDVSTTSETAKVQRNKRNRASKGRRGKDAKKKDN